ncbi:hypothetical protein BY996DRAFT_6607489 [Phakopsora pachyrhizi]|nr:hypothetical protein BY996DRAFT_6607489 [Phakopsora pachyrhizi]
MMTKICSSVYETSSKLGRETNLKMFDGTTYIEEQHPINIPKQDNQLQCYHCYSYENLNVNTNIWWCSVVKTNLNKIKMIIGGKVDCMDMELVRMIDGFEKTRRRMFGERNQEAVVQVLRKILGEKRGCIYPHTETRLYPTEAACLRLNEAEEDCNKKVAVKLFGYGQNLDAKRLPSNS